MNLSTKQKQHLKGLAHPLKPVVLLGSNGLTEGVLAEIEQALEHHELIKVKIATEDRETKTLIVEAIVRETGACNVQVIGKTLVLYRPTKERKMCKTRGCPQAGEQNATLCSLIKGRIAAFFLSLQYINILSIG